MAATFDSTRKRADVTLSNGDLTMTTATFGSAGTTVPFLGTGKYYLEVTVTADGTGTRIGLCDSSWDENNTPGDFAAGTTALGLDNAGTLRYNNTFLFNNASASYTDGDVVSMLYDADNNTISYWVNGSAVITDVSIAENDWQPCCYTQENATGITINFGASAYNYTMPVGYESWPDGSIPAGAITLSGLAPDITKFLSPDIGAIALAGSAPSISVGQNIQTGVGATAIAGLAPTIDVTEFTFITAGVGAVTLAGLAPYAVQPAQVAVTMEEMTAEATAGQGASASVTMRTFSGTSEVLVGTAAEGDAELEQLTAEAFAPDVTELELEELTVSVTALNGTIASADLVLRRPTAAAEHEVTGLATGTVTMQELTASAVSQQQNLATVDASLLRLNMSATAVAGTVGSADVETKKLEVEAVAYPLGVATASVELYKPRVNSFSEPVIAETYRTWVMNTANEALSEYTNFSFNSYAKFNDKEYAAGPGGLFELTGSDDNGTDVNWVIRTGMLDGKNANLKRLSELLFAMRYDGPVRVKVWIDDDTYYEYTLPNFRTALHQVRVTTGKGMKSRYYRIEIRGMNGGSCEIDSLQVPFEPVARRVG